MFILFLPLQVGAGWGGGGIWRMKLEGKGGRNTRRGGNVNTNSKLITLNKSIQSI